MPGREEGGNQRGHWAGTHGTAVMGRPGPQESLQGEGKGLADQLLAAQLHALHLGSAGLQPAPGAAVRSYHVLPQTGLAVGPPPVGAHAAPPGGTAQLDPALLGSDLFARLHMGAAAPLPAGLVAGAALPPAAAAHLQQQQQPQQRQPAAAGKRRGAAGNRRNEEKVRRTVYISDISDAVSEAQLASFFQDCGQLVDCRVCGDPNSSMRFAFIEFMTEEAAQQALGKSGSMLGDFPIRVSPSKTAIVPVNNTYLPRSNEERELVARTVFVGNIDRVVEREQLREFFDNLCGPVSKIRLLGDMQHNSKIAFVEFATAESARAALKLSGALLGTLPLRVSPSKTPVRVDSRRAVEGRGSVSAAPSPATPAPHSSLSPALLMAVAGLHLYPPHLAGIQQQQHPH